MFPSFLLPINLSWRIAQGASVPERAFREPHFVLQEFDVIGDVRGHGLMLGIDLVESRTSKTPATSLALRVKEACKCRQRVLIAIEGPHSNVIKIKPPIVFSLKDADQYTSALRQVSVLLSIRYQQKTLQSYGLRSIQYH